MAAYHDSLDARSPRYQPFVSDPDPDVDYSPAASDDDASMGDTSVFSGKYERYGARHEQRPSDSGGGVYGQPSPTRERLRNESGGGIPRQPPFYSSRTPPHRGLPPPYGDGHHAPPSVPTPPGPQQRVLGRGNNEFPSAFQPTRPSSVQPDADFRTRRLPGQGQHPSFNTGGPSNGYLHSNLHQQPGLAHPSAPPVPGSFGRVPPGPAQSPLNGPVPDIQPSMFGLGGIDLEGGNIGCNGMHNSSGCVNCSNLTNCSGCVNCRGCRGCSGCVSCTNCRDCVNCHNCSGLVGKIGVSNQHA